MHGATDFAAALSNFILDIYLDNLDSCDINIGGEDSQHYETNPNKLTKPEIIFYWEIILLVLHLALAGTSILLQRLEKEVTSDSEIFSREQYFSNIFHLKIGMTTSYVDIYRARPGSPGCL